MLTVSMSLHCWCLAQGFHHVTVTALGHPHPPTSLDHHTHHLSKQAWSSIAIDLQLVRHGLQLLWVPHTHHNNPNSPNIQMVQTQTKL